MAERVDVCIVGSGFGGSIAAWRLAELYRAAEQDAERARARARPALRPHRLPPVDGRRPPLRRLRADPGPGRADRRRQPGRRRLEPLPRRLAALADARPSSASTTTPSDGPRRRMWPRAISRKTLNRYYGRAEAGLRVRQPAWNEVSKSGGVWAAMLREAGHTCDRVPVAIDFDRCVDAKWCYTGCVFGAKNSLITNYLPSAERRGVEVRPLGPGRRGRALERAPLPLDRPRRRRRPGDEAGGRAGRDRVQGRDPRRRRDGHAADPDALAHNGSLPGVSPHLGRHLGVNGDHVAAIEFDSRKARSGARPAGRLRRLLQGQADHDDELRPLGRQARQRATTAPASRSRRSSSPSSPTSSTTTAATAAPSRPGGGGRRSARSRPGRATSRSWRWSRRRWTASSTPSPPTGNGHVQPNGGPVGIGLFNYAALRAVGADPRTRRRRRSGRSPSAAASAGSSSSPRRPASTRRTRSAARGWPTRSASASSTTRCEVFGYEGLFCMDSSVIPTSFGVNPSLSISAVCERAAAKLVARGADFGLPAPPPSLRHRPPGVHVGPAREAGPLRTWAPPRRCCYRCPVLHGRRPPPKYPAPTPAPLSSDDRALPRPAAPPRAPQRALRRRRVRARPHPQGPDREPRQGGRGGRRGGARAARQDRRVAGRLPVRDHARLDRDRLPRRAGDRRR